MRHLGTKCVVLPGVRHKPDTIVSQVALCITGAYWFISLTSYANPAATLARALPTTFAGINPANVPMFRLAQVCGTGLALLLTPSLWGYDAEQE